MDRKEIAQETLQIMRQGFYEYEGRRVEFSTAQKKSVENSLLFTPEQALECVRTCPKNPQRQPKLLVSGQSTVEAILDCAANRQERVGVLNFASAKNPGGGFLGGAMAQEESLAASSGLYQSLCAHMTYYETNRACKTMCYTHHAIYSPDVVFFRDGQFQLLAQPVTASVLTLPAVNYGQVLQKGEDTAHAKQVMRERMKAALALFAARGDRNLILGAYGCGVFRNDPDEIAAWWKELLEEGYGASFTHIFFAVLDHSKKQSCITAFRKVFA
ncbi:MAG: TIGR02452 family protein [Anaerotruncus sp.]|nr:TIGR02452 family protein [Anaerotruncus sp.]